MAVQFTTHTLTLPARLDAEPIRTLVPVDFSEPALDPEAAMLAARNLVASELGWHAVAKLERCGVVLLPKEAYRDMAAGSTRLKSLQIREWLFDLDLKQVSRLGKPLHLTPTEWALLELLVRRVDRVITQGELLLRVWGPAYLDEAHLLRVNMARLRAKLEPEHVRSNGGYTLIKTRPGVGYYLVGESAP
ncbi:MAG: winged helix-turn-helix domain-containing protein [Vicinamibacterales bacterium]